MIYVRLRQKERERERDQGHGDSNLVNSKISIAIFKCNELFLYASFAREQILIFIYIAC